MMLAHRAARASLLATRRTPLLLTSCARTLHATPSQLKPSLDPSSSSTTPTPPPFAPAPTSSSPKKNLGKEEGTIASVFASLSGGILEDALPDRFSQLKQSLISSPQHVEHLKSTWKSVLSSLSAKVAETERLGGGCIPEITYPSGSSSVGPLESWTDKATFQAIKDRGVAVIRNVIPSRQALQWKEDIKSYAKQNGAKGFPASNPQVYELYWTPAQLAARSHPNLLTTSQRFLSLFRKPSTPTSTCTGVETACSLTNPLTYVDRLRIRQPGDAQFALGAHIDGGGVERWECSNFRGLWSNILQDGSNWSSHDPWSLGEGGERMTARTDMYDGPGQCGVFRPLQGWLSLSHTRAGEGTLRVLPFLRESTAYIILRPFFTHLKPASSFSSPSQFLDASNWVFDGTSLKFPGCSLGHNIELSPETHPHLELEKTTVSIPDVRPGDMVLWHCDAVHSVEKKHGGVGDSSVLYIPAIPTTKVNWEYVMEQKKCFDEGRPPPDFPGGSGESGFKGRGTEEMVNGGLARTSMGLERFDLRMAENEEERRLLEWCNANM
ncbi:related to DUF1479 domain protein [Ustilago sp. UG-2017b]|nr:related to DUF1479 domain protein [Ustilago sp. UG-2017b]